METPLLIGTYGWAHPAWNSVFYDPDLPPEWRLSWYANHLRAVMVPAQSWPTLDVAAVSTLLDDTDETFRFVIELPPADRQNAKPPWEDSDRIATRVRAFAGQADAVLLSLADSVAPEWPALERFRAALHPAALCLDGLAAGQLPAGFGSCWCPAKDQPLVPSDYTITCCDSGEPRLLRKIIEALQRELSGRGALILTDTVRGYEHAREARIIAELLEAT